MTKDEFLYRCKEAKIKAKWKVEDMKTKAKENKDEIIGWSMIVAPIVLGSAVEITKAAAKLKVAKEDQIRRERTVYDPSSGFYYRTNRDLTNKMKREIDRRHTEDGERYGEILEDMKLLSRK